MPKRTKRKEPTNQQSFLPEVQTHYGITIDKFQHVELPEEIRAIYARAFHIKKYTNMWSADSTAFLVDLIPLADNADPNTALEIAAVAVQESTDYTAEVPQGIWTEFYKTVKIKKKPLESIGATPSKVTPIKTTEGERAGEAQTPPVDIAAAHQREAQNNCTQQEESVQPEIRFKSPKLNAIRNDLEALANCMSNPALHAHDMPHRVWQPETISFLVAVATASENHDLREEFEVLLNLTTTDLVQSGNPISDQISTLIMQIKRSQNLEGNS